MDSSYRVTALVDVASQQLEGRLDREDGEAALHRHDDEKGKLRGARRVEFEPARRPADLICRAVTPGADE